MVLVRFVVLAVRLKKIMLKKIFFLLLLASPVVAQQRELPENPVPKIEREQKVVDKHFWIVTSVALASNAAPLFGGVHCRDVNGVEPCTAHYGAFYQTWAWTAGISAFAGTGLYHMCRKETHNSLKCDLIQHTITSVNIGWGVHEWTIRDKKEVVHGLKRH